MSNDLLSFDAGFENLIFNIRGKDVMIANDLASMYQVKTSNLNLAVKRNPERFPEDFMFQLTEEEQDELIAKCNRLESLKYSTEKAYVFTKEGSLQLSGVLRSKIAIQTSIMIHRTFVRREEEIKKIIQQSELEKEKKLLEYKTSNNLLQAENKKLKPAANIFLLYYADSDGCMTVGQVSDKMRLGKGKKIRYLYSLLVKYNIIEQNYVPVDGYEDCFSYEVLRESKRTGEILRAKLKVKPLGFQLIKKLVEIEEDLFKDVILPSIVD